ncbi:MAG: peptidylprolyl isomerase [Ignavibacteriales bacterium]|nr:peptidylprolyl isomerase [Ignavibacteriales bacterium]
MRRAGRGDTVKIQFVGRRETGEIFDRSKKFEALEFTLGSGAIIKGVEEATLGMAPEETKRVSLHPELAFGKRRDDLLMKVDRADVPEGLPIEIGAQWQIPQDDRQPIVVRVADYDEETVTLDGNHPFAGERLEFEITLLEIVEE